jgi:hypothetical protein
MGKVAGESDAKSGRKQDRNTSGGSTGADGSRHRPSHKEGGWAPKEGRRSRERGGASTLESDREQTRSGRGESFESAGLGDREAREEGGAKRLECDRREKRLRCGKGA